MQNRLLSIVSYLFVLASTATAQDQVTPRFGIRAGYEFADYFSSNNASFKRSPGSAISIFTTLSSASNSNSTAILGFELNFVSLLSYINDQHVFYSVNTPANNANVLYNAIFDEQFRYQFLEVAFPIEVYPSLFKNNMAFGIYVGPSIGLGSQEVAVNEKSRTFADSLRPSGLDGPDESNSFPYPGGTEFRFPFSLNFGVTFFYEFLIIDLRYKYTLSIPNSNSNVFLQLGLAH